MQKLIITTLYLLIIYCHYPKSQVGIAPGKSFCQSDGIHNFDRIQVLKQCVEHHFEAFVQYYDEHFSKRYGFWRPYIEKVICRYLDRGDLCQGFARVICKDRGHEYLLAFVLERCGNPASAGQKATFLPLLPSETRGEFGEWLRMDVLKKVPHRNYLVDCYNYFLPGNCSI